MDGARIRWFPAYDLPTLPYDRFKALFEVKKAWKLDEITPFIKEIVPPTSKAEQLLLQWTVAANTPTGIVYHAREF